MCKLAVRARDLGVRRLSTRVRMHAKSATPRVRVWVGVRVISFEGRGTVF